MGSLTETPMALILVLQINVFPTGIPNVPLIVHHGLSPTMVTWHITPYLPNTWALLRSTLTSMIFLTCSNPHPGRFQGPLGLRNIYGEHRVLLACPQKAVSHDLFLTVNVTHVSASQPGISESQGYNSLHYSSSVFESWNVCVCVCMSVLERMWVSESVCVPTPTVPSFWKNLVASYCE